MSKNRKLKLFTNITSFSELNKELQEIEKRLNELGESTASLPEEPKEEEGKIGDIRISPNVDKSYTFLVKTEDGWKTPVSDGGASIKFTDVPNIKNSLNEKKSIDEIESEDANTEETNAKKTIYDKKADKFVLPRPDYDSGWLEDANDDAVITVEHSLETTTFSLIDLQVSNSSTGANATWVNAVTDEGGEGAQYIVQVKDSNNIDVGTGTNGAPRIECSALTWTGLATHFRLRLWK